MRHLFLPALLGLALAGCTAAETQGPTAELAAPPVPAPSAPVVTGASAASSAAGFPPPPACATGSEPGCSTAARLERCRTVGAVTTCDVPGDPAADNTLYTN